MGDQLLSICQGRLLGREWIAEVRGAWFCRFGSGSSDKANCLALDFIHGDKPDVADHPCNPVYETDLRFHAYLAANPEVMAEYLRLKGVTHENDTTDCP